MVDDTKEAPTRHWVRWLTLLGGASLITLWVPSCLYDDSKPCGDDLDVLGDNERCVCPEGSVYSPTGCVECGEHQIVQGTACVCDEGYMMAADNTCQEIPESTTSTTSTSSTTGSGAGGSAGASGAGGEGGEGTDGGENTSTETATSTTGSPPECTVNDDCALAEICDAGVCRLPTGWGTTCTADGNECAGFEAGLCDAFQLKCTVADCSNTPNTCPSGFDCCDFSTVPPFNAIMCIPAGYCTTPAP